MVPLHDNLWERLLSIQGVEEGESSWGDEPALWVNGKQVANFTPDGRLELRLTRAVIREMKEQLAAGGRVEVRKNSDWIRIAIESTEQYECLLALAERAAAAHRAPGGAVPKPVPTGAAMARRKRFH
jgi:hypothetical protein